MAHIPYGYRIANGRIIVDPEKAEQVKVMFASYLSGMSFVMSAKTAGLELTHSSVKNILRNRRYLGNNVYPQIIEETVFNEVNEKIDDRIRENRIRKKIPDRKTMFAVPKEFRLVNATEHYDDPFEQAQYLYSIIERRDDGKERHLYTSEEKAFRRILGELYP